MNCYAVIDTNVLIASLLSSHEDSATVQVVEKVFLGEIIPLYSLEILEEYNMVLRRKKFHFSEETIELMLSVIEKYGEWVVASPSGEILPDMKDLPFYEVVLERQNENAYLVTGNNKHFPKKPFIVTPKELLEILSK